MHSASQMLWAFLDTSRHFKYIYLTHNIIINVYIAPGNEALDKPDTLTLLLGDHHDPLDSTHQLQVSHWVFCGQGLFKPLYVSFP